jgi:hypothetical protein
LIKHLATGLRVSMKSWFHSSLLMLTPKSIEFRFEYSNSSIRQKF